MRTKRALCKLVQDNLDGVGWYATAQAEIESVCELENWQADYFTGILACTSPRVSVKRNLRIAFQYCGTKRVLANVIKSVRTSIKTFDDSRTILGPKTGPFYSALRGDSSAVVLDAHMANLFCVDQKTEFRRKRLARWIKLVKNVADGVGLAPYDAQACLWFAQKRAINENPEFMPVLAEYRNWISLEREYPHVGKIEDDYRAEAFHEPIPF